MPNMRFLELLAWMDGGTIDVRYADDSGEHVIRLGQHWIMQYHDRDCVPGRLYLDRVLIPIRSSDEKMLLSILQALAQDPMVEQLDRQCIIEAIAFIRSKRYTEMPAQVVFKPIGER